MSNASFGSAFDRWSIASPSISASSTRTSVAAPASSDRTRLRGGAFEPEDDAGRFAVALRFGVRFARGEATGAWRGATALMHLS